MMKVQAGFIQHKKNLHSLIESKPGPDYPVTTLICITILGVAKVSKLFEHKGDVAVINQVKYNCIHFQPTVHELWTYVIEVLVEVVEVED